MPLELLPPVPWHPLQTMDDYLTELNAMGRSKDYIRMVRVGLSYFSEYVRSIGVVSIEDIERVHIVRFQAHLNDLRKPDGEPYATSYRGRLMTYVKGWFSWLERTGMLEANPWRAIKIPQPAKQPRPLEPEDVEALFEAHKRQAFQLAPFDYHQREVIITLLYSWGLRVHELCSINLAHVDMRLNSVTVRNKGGRKKHMPYGEIEKTVITRWLRHRAKVASYEEDALLLGRSGNRITPQRVWEIVTNLGKAAGVDVNPHRFRDTLGTTMLDHDVTPEVVMKLLGHTSRAMTMAYSRINDPVVTREHERVMQDRMKNLLRFNTPTKEKA